MQLYADFDILSIMDNYFIRKIKSNGKLTQDLADNIITKKD